MLRNTFSFIKVNMQCNCPLPPPSLPPSQDRNILSKLVVTEMGSEFEEARKTVVHKVVPEIINPISASNLDLAATISELLVEKTLLKLERINSKLVSALELIRNTHTVQGTTVCIYMHSMLRQLYCVCACVYVCTFVCVYNVHDDVQCMCVQCMCV